MRADNALFIAWQDMRHLENVIQDQLSTAQRRLEVLSGEYRTQYASCAVERVVPAAHSYA
jgi:hypothetical protein